MKEKWFHLAVSDAPQMIHYGRCLEKQQRNKHKALKADLSSLWSEFNKTGGIPELPK